MKFYYILLISGAREIYLSPSLSHMTLQREALLIQNWDQREKDFFFPVFEKK